MRTKKTNMSYRSFWIWRVRPVRVCVSSWVVNFQFQESTERETKCRLFPIAMQCNAVAHSPQNTTNVYIFWFEKNFPKLFMNASKKDSQNLKIQMMEKLTKCFLRINCCACKINLKIKFNCYSTDIKYFFRHVFFVCVWRTFKWSLLVYLLCQVKSNLFVINSRTVHTYTLSLCIIIQCVYV